MQPLNNPEASKIMSISLNSEVGKTKLNYIAVVVQFYLCFKFYFLFDTSFDTSFYT